MAGRQFTDDELTEDEILDRAKTRDRMMRRIPWVLTSGIALIAVVAATAVFSGHAALVTSMGGQMVILAFAGVLFVYAFVMIGKYHFQLTDADSPRLVHQRIDSNHRVWRRSILFTVFMLLFVVMMFFALMSLPHALPVPRPSDQFLLLAGSFFTGLMLLLVFILSAGSQWSGSPALPIRDDEFDSALRARMMRFGYVWVMLLLGAVFLVALWQPTSTLTALVWALYAGFAVPALYYLIADWRASRGGES